MQGFINQDSDEHVDFGSQVRHCAGAFGMTRTTPVLTRRAALAGATALLAAPAISRAQPQEALRFGAVDALTGPSALFGIDQIQAVRWAVDDINAKGGINGRKFEGVIIDHQA